MARLTICLEVAIARAVKKRATDQKRSTSSYIAMLLEQDLRESGALTTSAEAKLAAELRRLAGPDAPLQALRCAIAEVERDQCRTAEAQARENEQARNSDQGS